MSLPRLPAPKDLFFKGRPGDTRLGEWVIATDDTPPRSRKEQIVLLGCPDDQGVVLNRGRAGAKDGPDSIRKHLYRMTPPMDFAWEKTIELFDLGNALVSKELAKTHENVFQLAKALSAAGCTILALGGGHDFAAPNFLGWREGHPRKKVSLINVDPHLDVRPLENGQAHSGTPFRIILESGKIEGKQFLQFGTKANRNAREHFAYCQKQGVKIHSFESLQTTEGKGLSHFKKAFTAYSLKAQKTALTIDMDCCEEAEGTSAAPAVGFRASELCAMAAFAGAQKKVTLLEIAEIAPPLDPTERSSRIAAEILFSFIDARARSR